MQDIKADGPAALLIDRNAGKGLLAKERQTGGMIERLGLRESHALLDDLVPDCDRRRIQRRLKFFDNNIHGEDSFGCVWTRRSDQSEHAYDVQQYGQRHRAERGGHNNDGGGEFRIPVQLFSP